KVAEALVICHGIVAARAPDQYRAAKLWITARRRASCDFQPVAVPASSFDPALAIDRRLGAVDRRVDLAKYPRSAASRVDALRAHHGLVQHTRYPDSSLRDRGHPAGIRPVGLRPRPDEARL